MEESTSREKVLKKIRKALIQRGDDAYLGADFDKEIFTVSGEEPEIVFAQKLAEHNGNFIFCLTEEELFHNLAELFHSRGWKEALCKEEEIYYFLHKSGIKISDQVAGDTSAVAVSLCECVVARSGSFFVSSAQNAGRRFYVDNDVHIVIAFSSQVVNTIEDGFNFIKVKYEGKIPSMLTLVSGPSKTADIEQTLVYGAHGPKELFFFLVEG
jgi:L-lactate dehydrogenase complex protein LldG